MYSINVLTSFSLIKTNNYPNYWNNKESKKSNFKINIEYVTPEPETTRHIEVCLQQLMQITGFEMWLPLMSSNMRQYRPVGQN